MKIVFVTSDVTLENLEHIEQTQERTKEKPEKLLLQDIHVADQAFQWRVDDDNLLADRDHIKGLARALQSQGRPLDAILVTAIGSRFYAIDGHHRLAAYHTIGWKKLVPVEVFDGSVRDAWTEALQRNVRDKLPMTSEAKYEAAWKLNQVKTPNGKYVYSKTRIKELTTASDGTIAKMRKILETWGDEVSHMTWRQAKSLRWKQENPNYEYDVWKDEKAREIADALVKSTKINFSNKTDVLARALEMISPSLPAALIGEWLGMAYEIVEEHRDELEAAAALDI